MRHNTTERRKELECAVALRQKEAEELQRRKAQLEEEISADPAGTTHPDDLSAAYPVLDYCGARPKKDVRSIPIEQVGGVMAQFELVKGNVAQRNRALQRQVHDLNRRIEVEGRRWRKVKQDTTSLADATGALINAPSGSNERESVPRANDADVTLEELEMRKALIAKEIRVGRQILEKKEKAILSMVDKIRERENLLDEIDALNNDIRVVDRDRKCEEETLRGLTAENDIVTAKLTKFEENNESASCLLIKSDIAEIKEEIGETVKGSRRSQERIMKAQDYRLEQLERRMECIEKALKSNRLARNVNTSLTRGWEASNGLILSGDDVDMYDLDAINPAEEKCHPAIYKLLLIEKDRLSRRNTLLDTLADEKGRVVAALTCKVEALSRDCQEAIQDLDQVVSGAAYEEEKQRIKAMEYIHEQRMHYCSLLLEKVKLKTKLLSTPRKTTEKKLM